MQIAEVRNVLTRTQIFALILVTVEDLRDPMRSAPARIAVFAITLFLASVLYDSSELSQQGTTLKRMLTCGLIALAFWTGGDRNPTTWSAIGLASLRDAHRNRSGRTVW